MKKILIIVCSGTINRGTEALVRGTITLLEMAFIDNFTVTLASSMPEIDYTRNLPHITKYIHRITPNKSIKDKFKNKINTILHKQYVNIKELICEAKTADLILEVGADNYDIAYNLYPSLHFINKKLRKKCHGKLFLFDCSLNQESINQDFINELALFDAFSVREIQTLENIKQKYKVHNICFIPDPAFIMEPEPVDLPIFWQHGKMIGINLSTLIVGAAYGEKLEEKVIECYKYMIDQILSHTDLKIVLIPHVMNRADLNILEKIKDIYPNNRRVCLIFDESYSAPQLKYIISNCRFFVGARTHATIAAYSSYVPTLVLGYSTKSIGIARDLFNTSQGHVISVQELIDKDTLWNALEAIMNNESAENKMLKTIMPKYQQKIYEMSNIFMQLLKDE